MTNNKLIIVGIIALREAKFWTEVFLGEEFKDKRFLFISYCSVSSKYLEDNGFQVFCTYKNVISLQKNGPLLIRDANDPIFLHESVTFLESKKYVFSKYKKFYNQFYFYLNIFLKKISIPNESVFVFQELGAFAPVIALKDVCQKLKIKHFFFEPSIIPGYTFLLKNTFKYSTKKNSISDNNFADLDAFCHQISNSTPVAFKDLANIESKSLSSYNLFFKRIFRKLEIKFSPKKNTYYDKIIPPIMQRLKRALSNNLLNLFLPEYSKKNLNSFIYYPLHSDIDFALTVRNPEYLNQYKNLIKLLKTNNVVIKQHPTRGYTFTVPNLISLFLSNINSQNKVYLAKASSPSISISKMANSTFFISSKAGIFAMIFNLKTDSPISLPFKNSSPKELYTDICERSFPFDLYNSSVKNLKSTKNFIKNFLV